MHLRLGILSPANVISPTLKVILEDSESSVDLNDRDDSTNEDFTWIDDLDINESQLMPKQKERCVIVLIKQFCNVFSQSESDFLNQLDRI